MDQYYQYLNNKNKYIKVAENEYVQQKNEYAQQNNTGHQKIHFTPTFIKTYPDGNPACLFDIQAISYRKSGVLFFKDYENNCCIDIYDSDQNNLYKCRIIGINGYTHFDSSFPYRRMISVYNVLSDIGSFVNNDQRLICVDSTGLYIIYASENTIESITSSKISDNTLNLSGSVIKISAFDGNKTINDQPIVSSNFTSSPSEASSDAVFCFNCSKETPISIGTIFAPITKIYPVMKQIEDLTNISLKSLPPSEKSAKKRIADIIGVHEDQIYMKNGKAYLIEVRVFPDSGEYDIYESYFKNYKQYIPLIRDDTIPDELFKKVYSILESGLYNYGVYINKQLALKPWDNI